MNNLEQIINNDYVVKAYTTPDNKFLKVETKNGTVITIWEKWEGYQFTHPIKPNKLTGSSVGECDYYDYYTYDELIKKLETEKQECPHWFNAQDRQATKFLTIEEAVELHENIMNYNKVK